MSTPVSVLFCILFAFIRPPSLPAIASGVSPSLQLKHLLDLFSRFWVAFILHLDQRSFCDFRKNWLKDLAKGISC